MLKLEAARKSLGTEPIKMTDDELTYAKEAKRKRGANVVEQEFAQPKHRKDRPKNKKKNKPVCATSQQGTSCTKPSSIITAALKEENLPPEEKDQSANRNKGKETPPTSTSVENNNSLDELDNVCVSPEFSEDLISDLGTGDVNNYINSFIASNTESSTASVVVSIAPTYTTLQLATTAHMYSRMSILNTLPGGLTLEKTVKGLVVCLVSPLSPLSPACLNLLDVNFKRMSSIL